MMVRPVLGGWEIPRIASIESLERRSFVELPIPGRTGNLLQDLNTSPTRIAISGSLYGDEDRNEFLDEVRAKFQEGEPVTFVADIVTATTVEYVVIETLHFEESALKPDQIDYLIILKESPPPPPPEDPLGGLDDGLLDEAGNLVDSVTGALDVIDALSIPDFGDPTEPLSGTLSGIESALTDLDGVASTLTDLFGEG